MEAPLARFTIERDLAATSKNRLQYRGFREISAANGQAKLVALDCWRKAGSPGQGNLRPVRIVLTVRRARKLDVANLVSAWHPYQDALFTAVRPGSRAEGITPDDDDQWISQAPEIRFEIAPEWQGREEFVVEVWATGEPLPAPPPPRRRKGRQKREERQELTPETLRPLRAPDWRQRRSWGRRGG